MRPNRQTHIVTGILVGADIQQQPHAVRVTLLSGTHQRRQSVLRACMVPKRAANRRRSRNATSKQSPTGSMTTATKDAIHARNNVKLLIH
jgi:hypothetical protein